jgi:hypothetical protein
MVETIISFIVSVPVLSVLIALVAPSVSTSVRFLTTARASASCLAPSESRPDTNAGSPVGIAEIAIAVPSSTRSSKARPRIRPTTTMKATALHAMTPRTFVSESSSLCSGDRTRDTEVSIVAIRPISVSAPVAVTTIAPVQRVTEVFWNSMSVRSPSTTSGVGSTAASLATGALSPVSAASWVSSVAERMIRPSAGAMSHASTSTMSPTTTSRAGTCTMCPPRTTRVCGTCIFDSASTLALALSSWREPRTTLSRMSSATMIPVGTSPMAKLTAVTAMSMMFIGSRSCSIATCQTDGGFSPVISFGPSRARRAAASAWVSPWAASVSRAATTAASSCANHVSGPCAELGGWRSGAVEAMGRSSAGAGLPASPRAGDFAIGDDEPS